MRVVLADDHQIFRDGIKLLLEGRTSHQVVAETGDAGALKALVHQHRPDMLVLDYHMPGGEITALVDYFKKSYDGLKVVILTGAQSGALFSRLRKAGADAILIKAGSGQHLLDAIDQVARGRRVFTDDVVAAMDEQDVDLTMREFQVLQLLCQGLTSAEIAERFSLSERTVGKHRENTFRKMHVSSVPQLINRARELGLL